jgi:predicted alpha/beta-hydrolase family hydrolase
MMTESRTWSVSVEETSTTVVWESATTAPTGAVFVCAHGAGGHMSDGSVMAVTVALRARGIATVRFNFLYKEAKHGRPDAMPRLLACFEAVVGRVRAELAPAVLVLGGRSMGGRAASVLVSKGATCDGLLLLAYPLHPPAQPAKLRVDHLPSIRVPVLCLSGTRDPFCTPELMTRTIGALGPGWRLHWLDAADHSFHVLKRSGRTNQAVMDEVAEAVAAWAGNLPGA